MRPKINCKNCLSDEVLFREQVFENGTRHLRAECKSCGKFIQYVEQEISYEEAASFKMPFGKHQGKTIEQIGLQDPDYLAWAAVILKPGNVKRRIKVFQDGMPEHVSEVIPRVFDEIASKQMDFEA